MPQVEGNADGTAGVARCGLDPDLIEWSFPHDASVPDAIERHAAGEAQVLQRRFAVGETDRLEHHLLGDLLNRAGEVHFALRQRRFRLARWSAKQMLEPHAGHRQAVRVLEVLHVHPQAAVGSNLEKVVFDERDVFRFAIGREPHHLVLARVDAESREVCECRIQQPERVGEALFAQQRHLAPVPDAN
jgi:hypothetical protein